MNSYILSTNSHIGLAKELSTLSGIPYLDSLLTYKKIKVKPKIIKNSGEDSEDEYFWGVFNEGRSHSSYTSFLSIYKEENGWSVASIEENGNIWFLRPICVGPFKITCDSIFVLSPISTSGPIKQKGPISTDS